MKKIIVPSLLILLCGIFLLSKYFNKRSFDISLQENIMVSSDSTNECQVPEECIVTDLNEVDEDFLEPEYESSCDDDDISDIFDKIDVCDPSEIKTCKAQTCKAQACKTQICKAQTCKTKVCKVETCDIESTDSNIENNQELKNQVDVCKKEQSIALETVEVDTPKVQPLSILAPVQKEEVKEVVTVVQNIETNDELELESNVDTLGQVQGSKKLLPVKVSQEEKSKCVECTQNNFDKPSILFLGQLYNHALVEDCEYKKWLINASLHYDLEFKAFDCCGRNVCLSNLLFGNFTIEDVFLLSKLSFKDKLYIVDFTLPLKLSRSVRNIREEQYLAYLAPFNVCIDAEKREKVVDFGAIRRFNIGCREKVVCSLGFNIPIKSSLHIMNLDLVGVDLRDFKFTTSDINFVLTDFHADYIDISDFFTRVILEPKGLCFRNRQRKIGIGDISLFTLFDLNKFFDKADGFQIGFDLTLPTGNRYKGKDVWEIILGNSGAVRLGFSSNVLFKTSRKFVNPTFSLAGKYNFKFDGCRRIPMLIENNSDQGVVVDSVPDLIVSVFDNHLVKEFSEYDSCVRYFADQLVSAKIKLGSMVMFGFGNYFYNVFKEAFRLGVFYDFTYKGKDKICVCDKSKTYNPCIWQNCSDIKSHKISWHLAYASKAGVEVNIGSKHVLGGKNTPKTNSIFASLVANF